MAPVTFKVTFGRTIRRFEADGTIGWQGLVGKVRELFSLPNDSTSAIRLTYVDEDGDLITLDSDQEMQAILADANRRGAQVVRFRLEEGTASHQETEHQTSDGSLWVFAEDSDENKETDDPNAAKEKPKDSQQVESGTTFATKPYNLADDNDGSTLKSNLTDNSNGPEAAHHGEGLSVQINLVTQDDDDSDIEELDADPLPNDEKASEETETHPKEDTAAEDEHTDNEDESEDNGIYLVIYLPQDLPNLFRRRRFCRPPTAPSFFPGWSGHPHPFFRPHFNPYAAFSYHNSPFTKSCPFSGMQGAFNVPAYWQEPTAHVFAQTPCHRATAAANGTSSDSNTCQRGPRTSCKGRTGCAKKPSQATPDNTPPGCSKGRWGAYCSFSADADTPKPTRCYRGRRRAGFCKRPDFSVDASCSVAGPSSVHTEQPHSQDPTAIFQHGWRAFLTDQLAILKQMGFEDEALNRKLLERYNGSIVRVIDAQTRGKDAEDPVEEKDQMVEDL